MTQIRVTYDAELGPELVDVNFEIRCSFCDAVVGYRSGPIEGFVLCLNCHDSDEILEVD